MPSISLVSRAFDGADAATEFIPKFPADVYYVTKSGSDTNSGIDVSSPYLTITKAISEVSPGDKIVVGAGEYIENVDLDVANVTIDFSVGVILSPTTGTGLEVSGGNNLIDGYLRINAVAGEAGVHVHTNAGNIFKNIKISGGSTGYDIDSASNEFYSCFSSTPTSYGFDINGGGSKLYKCSTAGNSNTTVGFFIAASISKGILSECTSAGHGGGGFSFSSGANYWTILNCSSGAGDGKWTDADDSNVWANFSFADRLYHCTPLTATGGDEYGSGPTAADGTHYNLFKVIGAVRVHALIGHVVTQCAATSSTINIELTSAGGTVDITDSAGGPDLNAAPVGTVFIRNSISTDPLDSARPNTQPQIIEDANFRTPDMPLPLLADTGDDTFITLVLSSAIASGEIHWHIHWEPITDDGIVESI